MPNRVSVGSKRELLVNLPAAYFDRNLNNDKQQQDTVRDIPCFRQRRSFWDDWHVGDCKNRFLCKRDVAGYVFGSPDKRVV
jgi:hypothetical protein